MSKLLASLRASNYYLFELFLFLRLSSVFASAIAYSMLLQDKLCYISYNQTAAFCQNIQADISNTSNEMVKNDILAETTRFSNYKNVLECIPMFIWSMFVGSFLDKFPGGTNIILFLNLIGSTFTLVVYILNMYAYEISPYYLLIGSLSISFTGGMISLLTSAYRYITLSTNETNRSLKFVTLEIIYIIGVSLAVFLGGQLLVLRVVDKTSPQLRTYGRNFFTSLVIDGISFVILFALTRVDKSAPEKKNLQDLEDSVVYSEIEDLITLEANNNYDAMEPGTSADTINDKQSRRHLVSASEDTTSQYLLSLKMKEGGLKNFFRSLFDIDNVQQTLNTFFKKREGFARLQIFLLYLILFSQILTTQGISVVMLQWTERVYNWNSTNYSTFTAVSTFASMLLLAIGSLIFIKKMQLSDDALIIISQLSSFFKNIILGTFLSPAVFFVSILVGSLSGFTPISARTKLSKIVSADEVGKIFSLSSTIDALIPIIGSLIYTNLFSISISTFPGLIYQFSAFVMFLSLVVIVFERIYCPVIENSSAERSREYNEL